MKKVDTFDGAKLCSKEQSLKAPLSINPEHAPAFKPESRRIDLTNKVMQKVVRFEKRRTAFWLFKFFLILTIFVEIFFLSLWLLGRNIIESKTYELLSLFSEDREIIAQFWQDTLEIIWEEMPKNLLLIVILSLIFIILIIIILHRNIKLIRKKIRLLAKKSKE